MFITVELLYGTWERVKRKENDRASVISHTIKYEKQGVQGKGVRESIQRD
jgi:hypothetical protein